MLYYPSTFLLVAATYLPHAFGCVYFNATLHDGDLRASSAEEANAIAAQQKSGADLGDVRLDLSLWDDVDNDNVVDALSDNFCSGVDIKPYRGRSRWVVPCDPTSKGVELDVVYDPDITEGGVLINTLKYKNPRVTSVQDNDPDGDLVFTFQALSEDKEGKIWQGRVYCDDCKSAEGQSLKCTTRQSGGGRK